MILVRRDIPPHFEPHVEHTHEPPARMMRRIFSPVPKMYLYFMGVVVVMAILAPFWLAVVSERFGRKPIIISDETPNTTPSWSHVDTRPRNDATTTETPISPLDQFEGIHLNATRESLEPRFALYLKNTRGMTPEIYEARDARGIERLTAYFYNGELKEFVAVQPPRLITPEELLRTLRIQYGDPADWTQGEGAPTPATVPGIEAGRYAEYALYRQFSWHNDNDRLDVTVFYTTPDPVTCQSLLVVHTSAAKWLKNAREALTPLADLPSTPPPTETHRADAPPRLFP